MSISEDVENSIQAQNHSGLENLDRALSIMATVAIREKHLVLKARVACVLYDRKLSVEEVEVLRGIADLLSSPMPPLLLGQPAK